VHDVSVEVHLDELSVDVHLDEISEVSEVSVEVHLDEVSEVSEVSVEVHLDEVSEVLSVEVQLDDVMSLLLKSSLQLEKTLPSLESYLLSTKIRRALDIIYF